MLKRPKRVGKTALATSRGKLFFVCLFPMAADFLVMGKTKYSRCAIRARSAEQSGGVSLQWKQLGWRQALDESDTLHPRTSAHPSFEGRRGFLDCRVACTVGDIP